LNILCADIRDFKKTRCLFRVVFIGPPPTGGIGCGVVGPGGGGGGGIIGIG